MSDMSERSEITERDPEEATPDGATEELKRRLSVSRAWSGLKRNHRVLSLQERVQHQLEVSTARATARRDRRQRREEERDAVEASALNDLHRRASVSGERARVRAQIQQSAEMRALRVSRVRTPPGRAEAP